MTFSSIFNPTAVHFDIKAAKKPSLIDCEGCGQATKKVGGRKCFCSVCAWINYLWLKKKFNAKYNEQRRLRAAELRSVAKMSHKADLQINLIKVT